MTTLQTNNVTEEMMRALIADWYSVPSKRSKTVGSAGDAMQRASVVDKVDSWCESEAEYFIDEKDDTYYVKLNSVNGSGSEILPIKGDYFKYYVLYRYKLEEGYSVTKVAEVESAADSVAAECRYKGVKRQFHSRVGYENGKLYYDLNNDNEEVVEISDNGVHIVQSPDIFFIRNALFYPQVVDMNATEQLTDLLEIIPKYFRVPSEDTVLLIAVLVSWFFPDIPKPIVLIDGEQGSGKTLMTSFIQKLIDPAPFDVAMPPENLRSMKSMVGAKYVSSLDNLSAMSDKASNFFCSVTTGGASIERRLYSNNDVIITQYKKCIILNGINNVANNPDLLSRIVEFQIKPIQDEERDSATRIVRMFEQDKPIIMKLLFELVCEVFKIYEGIPAVVSSRLADFYRMGLAVGQILYGNHEEFKSAFDKKQHEGEEQIVAYNPLSSSLVSLMDRYNLSKIDCRPGELFRLLTEEAQRNGTCTSTGYAWPKEANSFFRKFNLFKQSLAKMGIHVDERNSNGKAYKVITRDGVKDSNVRILISGFEKINIRHDLIA